MTYHRWFQEDSFTFLEQLRSDRISLILTDPPYDLNIAQKQTLQQAFLRICPCAIVFSPPENQWLTPADQYGFWVKPISTKNTSRRYSRFVEMIFFYGPLQWNCERHWSQYTNVFTDLVDDTSLHPYRKPPSLIERLILNHTQPGDWVLDPFAGSGVVQDVCKRLGRNSVSIEKEMKYCRQPLIQV